MFNRNNYSLLKHIPYKASFESPSDSPPSDSPPSDKSTFKIGNKNYTFDNIAKNAFSLQQTISSFNANHNSIASVVTNNAQQASIQEANVNRIKDSINALTTQLNLFENVLSDPANKSLITSYETGNIRLKKYLNNFL